MKEKGGGDTKGAVRPIILHQDSHHATLKEKKKFLYVVYSGQNQNLYWIETYIRQK